jgi:hypothetical protein
MRAVAAVLLVAALALAFEAREARAAEAGPAVPEPGGSLAPVSPVPSPFGPGYDPTRPAPEEPKESGPGIVTATVAAAGPADIEQLRAVGGKGASPFFGVVLDLELAGGSTTKLLGAESVVLQADNGSTVPLFAACAPTMDEESAVFKGLDVGISSWDVMIGDRSWKCGGRTARMAALVRTTGIRLTAKPGPAWKGPLVLLFEAQGAPPPRIVVAGITVQLPLPAKGIDKKN